MLAQDALHNEPQDSFNKEWIVSNFDKCLNNGHFHIYLQPQVDMNGKIHGAEVLARWIEADDESIPVGRFIPVLINAELITKLDLYIWDQAIHQLAQWKGTPMENLHLSVNVEPADIISVNVPEKIMELCNLYQVDIKKIHVEITERGFDSSAAFMEEAIRSFHEKGIVVEIDDFGSGTNTLSRLKGLDADVLKIDQNFIEPAGSVRYLRSQIILQSIVGLANSLNTLLVVEGVETEEQKESISKAGCCIYQGFLFSKPIPVRSFEDMFCKEDQY